MKRLFSIFVLLFTLLISQQSFAILNLELTQGVAGAMPIAVVPFAVTGAAPPTDISNVITNDLQNSGRFKVFGKDVINHFPSDVNQIKFSYWRDLGADNLVIGKITELGGNRYQVEFSVVDVFKDKDAETAGGNDVLISQRFEVNANSTRALAHHISDIVYEQLTGVRGVFSTRLAYILVQRSANAPTRYSLEVSDQDGYNPRPILISNDPIMSPAWSPNGKRIAYVSFENRRAAIYVADVASGTRRKVSEFPGINGAPAWSPDGHRLALVLSKSGYPKIYVMDIVSGELRQMTDGFALDTEPAWHPNGKSLIFTSNRGGNPQIYQLDVASRAVHRVTYDGKYNARASFTPDGNHIVVLHQDNGMYNIALLDLDTGTLKELNNVGEDQSPSVAPNGSMILFGSLYNGRSVLAMAANDGSVQLRLPSRDGEVQDPAWSPFLS